MARHIRSSFSPPQADDEPDPKAKLIEEASALVGRYEVVQRAQPAEEIVAWNTWTAFTDRAEVAPDCPRDAEWLARRFNEKTGGMTTPNYVRSLMPENHPNYPWTR